jgi:hypothetical protein
LPAPPGAAPKRPGSARPTASASVPRFLIHEPAAHVLTPADLAARPARFPFPVGERLEYAVTYLGIPAGTASLEIARFVEHGGRRYAHVVATARTNETMSKLYRVDDRSEAWIDLDAMRTVRTVTEEQHGDKHYREEVRFDWDTHFVHLREDKLHKRKREDVWFDFGPFVRDGFDLVYALRAFPLAPGFRARTPTYASRKVYEFEVALGEPGVIESPVFGTTRAVALQPATYLDGKPYSAGSGTLWLAPQAANAPLAMQGWMRTDGSSFLLQGLRAELVAYTPHAPGWKPAKLPALSPETWAIASTEGRPTWKPTAAVAAARAKAGVTAGESEQRLLPREVRAVLASLGSR